VLNKLYAVGIQQIVETEDKIGKMLTIDVETGEYVIDTNGVDGMVHLKNKRPVARLFVLRIGYDAAVELGG
jgi:H2-forming N5,N10-methylenetetrahydromethanopterin dehydrogenase-like enzyme